MSTTLIIVASATPAGLLGALVALAPSLRIRRRADIELAAADAAVAKAEELYAEHERTRNLPWHYATEAGELEERPEPWIADEDAWAAAALQPVDAEVLHVEHPTGELPLPASDQSENRCPECRLYSAHKPTCSRPVLMPWQLPSDAMALSDRPAEDEDAWGDEQPGEAWFDRLAAWLRSVWLRRPDFLKSHEERAAEFWAEPEPTSEAEELELLDQQWRTVVADARKQAGVIGRHGSDVHAVDTGYRGQRWAQDTQHTGTFPVVPAQRSGDADA